jgi:hypothetical protein
MQETESGQREAMSKVDTAWLRMERPTNRMMITGVLMFSGPLDPERIKALLAERFLAFRRFRQKAVMAANSAYWETDPDFDIGAHVRVARLPGKAGKAELEAFVSELASTSLDMSRPLWQLHLIEVFGSSGGRGGVLFARIHLCFSDGLALV